MPDRPWYLDVEPRKPTAAELAVLERILSEELPGVERLRTQLHDLTVRPSCGCGCPSIALIHPDGPQHPDNTTKAGPLPIDVTILPGGDEPPGGMIVFVTEDGYLVDLEVYSHGATISEMPPVERLLVEPLAD
jgi:hypothetical protein